MVRRWCNAQAEKHTGIPEERREYDFITPKEINLLICVWFMVLLLCCYANLHTFCRSAQVFPLVNMKSFLIVFPGDIFA